MVSRISTNFEPGMIGKCVAFSTPSKSVVMLDDKVEMIDRSGWVMLFVLLQGRWDESSKGMKHFGAARGTAEEVI